MVPFMVFVPAGTFMFGIGLNNGASWPVLAVGYAMYNFGSAPATLVAVTYLMDSYTEVNAFSQRYYFRRVPLTPFLDSSRCSRRHFMYAEPALVYLCLCHYTLDR